MKCVVAILVFSYIGILGCTDHPPEFVYVPGESVQEEVRISAASTTVKVGESVILHGSRETRGLFRVEYKSLPEGACWWRSEPLAYESEVADNLRWTVDRTGSATFNVDLRKDHTREVKFSEPGLYRLQASSAVWCPPETWSNIIAIEVRARQENIAGE